MRTAIGNAVDNDDMHWTVNCPECERELEYTGYFDRSDLNKCKCGCEFLTERVEFENGDFIQ